MEDYLKDSPSDIGTGGTTDSAGAGRDGTQSTSYENDWKAGFPNMGESAPGDPSQNSVSGFDYSDFLGSGGRQSNDSAYRDGYSDRQADAFGNNPPGFRSSYAENAPYGSGEPDLSSFGMNAALSPGFDPQGSSNPELLAPDPFLDDLEALGFPHHEPVRYVNPATTANLDELISPENADTFLNPQYFSPTNQLGFRLDLIAETSAQQAFSPRRQSISAGVGLAPGPSGHRLPYLSPAENLLDTLRSPPFSGSFLQSPPHIRIPQAQSVPESQNSSYTGALSPLLGGKQLTREEKLKRRREFHNAVERRRRDLIKERIKDLGLLVPPLMLNPQLCAVQSLQRTSQLNTREINELLASIKVKETKPNKSTILHKLVDYLLHLKYVLEKQRERRAELESQISALEGQVKREEFNPGEYFLDVVDR